MCEMFMTWDQHVEKKDMIPGSQNKRIQKVAVPNEAFLQVLFIALKGSSDELECHPDTNVCVSRKPPGSTSHHHLLKIQDGSHHSFPFFCSGSRWNSNLARKKTFCFLHQKIIYIISTNPPRPTKSPFNWPTASWLWRLKKVTLPPLVHLTISAVSPWGRKVGSLRKLPSPRFWIFKRLSSFSKAMEFRGWLVSGWKLVGFRVGSWVTGGFVTGHLSTRLTTFWLCWKDLLVVPRFPDFFLLLLLLFGGLLRGGSGGWSYMDPWNVKKRRDFYHHGNLNHPFRHLQEPCLAFFGSFRYRGKES